MSDTFQDVTEAATISGILLGAPDYLDRDEQLDIALRHIADLHEEIARLTKASDLVRSRTYESFFPILTTAFIYFAVAWLLALALERFGRRFDPACVRKGASA